MWNEPFQVFFVVQKYLTCLRHDPYLTQERSASPLLVAHKLCTYLCVVLDILWRRDKCHRLALVEDLNQMLTLPLLFTHFMACDVVYHDFLKQTSLGLAWWLVSRTSRSVEVDQDD